MVFEEDDRQGHDGESLVGENRPLRALASAPHRLELVLRRG